ncbi:MAG TPA: enoyl-CoA hydratase-related protein [Gemmatimonadaceae bacterium]|nr:enoyl-CoA hydratase-related protein [Gemmatimonadaceae bacterium]
MRPDAPASAGDDAALVVTSRDGAIATLVINRPDKHNALSAGVRRALLDAVSACSADPDVRVIIITGAGEKSFVAGADIAEFATRTPVDQYRVMRAPSPLEAIERSPKPVIAAINGYCLGGGLELAMACDFRLASDRARFGQPEINLGIIPGGGGTQRLPRLIGLGHAMRMILSGEPIDAAEALRVGLVQEVVPSEDLMSRTRDIAGKIAAKSPVALAAAKEATRAALQTPLAEGLRVESGLYLLAFSSADKDEGVRAFLEKRPPHFTGR